MAAEKGVMTRDASSSANFMENADALWSMVRGADAFRTAPKQIRADQMVLGADLYLNTRPPADQKLRCLKRSFLLWRKATRLVPTHAR